MGKRLCLRAVLTALALDVAASIRSNNGMGIVPRLAPLPAQPKQLIDCTESCDANPFQLPNGTARYGGLRDPGQLPMHEK